MPANPSRLFTTNGPGQSVPEQLTGQTMLLHAQPLILQDMGDTVSVGYTGACEYIPNMLSTTAVGAPSTAEGIASWQACRARELPRNLVDAKHGYHTMVPFGANNMLAILTSTLVITAAFAWACLPAVYRLNFGVPVAHIILGGSFLVNILLPLNDG